MPDTTSLLDDPAFKAWFGNSKVRTPEGLPQVCYHATAKDFEAFLPGGTDPRVSGHAIWLSPYPEYQAAAHNVREGKPGARVLPLYVKMERPLVIDDKPTLEWAREIFAKGSNEFPQLMPQEWMQEVTRDGEYDGILFKGEDLGFGPNSDEIIVFEPEQVKSAIGNTGAFDPKDHRVTAARPVPEAIPAIIQEFMEFLDPGHVISYPTVGVVDKVTVHWLGLCESTYTHKDRVITSVESKLSIQKGVLIDPATMRRVMAHEVVHHVANWRLVVGKTFEDAKAASVAEGSHGNLFRETAALVNEKYGVNFITQFSDEADTYERKEVNLFILANHQHDMYVWSWATSIPGDLVAYMTVMNGRGNGTSAFVGKTKSPALVFKESKYPLTRTASTPQQIQALVSAMETQTNLFPDYASGVKATTPRAEKRWTLIMANPYREGMPHRTDPPTQINCWAIARSLTSKEQDLIQQLSNLGIEVRVHKITGERALFNTLPKLDMLTVAYRYGTIPMMMTRPEVQDLLHKYWPTAIKTEPIQKSASTKRTIYLDMDGVLVDYDKGAEEAGKPLDEFHALPGAFRDLDLLPGALQAIQRLQAGPHRVCLLSCPSKDRVEESSAEKMEWAKHYLPMIDPRDIYLTTDKATIGTENDILVDDHPDWNGAENFKGTVIHFKGPETWEEVMTHVNHKVAGFWDADSERYNSREDTYKQNEVQRGLRQHFNQLLNGLTVQPNGQNMTLRQFLVHNPVTELFKSTDRSVRLMGNRLRSELDAFLKENYTPQQIQQFQQQHGNNVTDWILKKVVAKKAVLFIRKKKAALFQHNPRVLTK